MNLTLKMRSNLYVVREKGISMMQSIQKHILIFMLGNSKSMQNPSYGDLGAGWV